MSWKKGKVLVSLLVLSFFLLACTDEAGEFSLKPVWEKIIWFGSLGFIKDVLGLTSGEALLAFMRVLVAILVFALLFEASGFIGLSRNVRIVVAIILAIMSAIFIPANLLAGIGGAYAAVVSFVLLGIPVAGGFYALMRIPSTSRGWIALKIVIILLLIWILISIKAHAQAVTGLPKLL